jgi:two-component system response regulator AtoC
MKDADAPSDFFVAPEITADVPISLKVLTKRAVRDMERQIILKALQAHNWNRRRTALSLRISYRALLYKIRDAGLPFARARKADGDFGGEAEEFGRKPESEAMSD